MAGDTSEHMSALAEDHEHKSMTLYDVSQLPPKRN